MDINISYSYHEQDSAFLRPGFSPVAHDLSGSWLKVVAVSVGLFDTISLGIALLEDYSLEDYSGFVFCFVVTQHASRTSASWSWSSRPRTKHTG